MEAIALNNNSWYFTGAIGYAYLFKGEKAALLVDTTNGPGDLKGEVQKLVGDLPIILVNTHGDGDHIGCNDQFETTLMHPAEFSYYTVKRKAGYAVPQPIQEGDTLDIGGRVFEVIHMPGHTPGSIVLLNREERVLVGGDCIVPKVFIFGPQRNLRALIASLTRLKEKFGDAFDTVYNAHGNVPLDKSFIDLELAGAKALLAGELEPTEAPWIPLEGPEFRPASLYNYGEIGFCDYTEPDH